MSADNKKTLVISGVNMAEGGILSVQRHLVRAAEDTLDESWRIIALVHKKELFDCKRAEVHEFPDIKSSWLKRIIFEYVTSRRISKKWKPDVWFSAHDMTPNVIAKKQYVYCHNPTCFTKPSLRALYYDKKIFLFTLFYHLLYRLNIGKNDAVFVQQSWIGRHFSKRFGAKNVIISKPVTISPSFTSKAPCDANHDKGIRRWVYPTLPRHFKNIEVLGDALAILEQEESWDGEILITISGDENRYSGMIKKRYGHLRSLKLIGRKTPDEMADLYSSAEGLIFPSKLETWGLPITEAQRCNLPLLIADLDYAHETVGNYRKAAFFNPDDSANLAKMLRALSLRSEIMKDASFEDDPSWKILHGWEALIREVCH
jgi:glycosyltransferase involved in cell wall biosynthesis